LVGASGEALNKFDDNNHLNMIEGGLMKTKLCLIAIFSILLTAGLPGFSFSQADYPNKPIQIVVAQPPGGSTDIVIRGLAQEAKRYLGQDLVIINKPGASGTVGSMQVAVAKPDGYTLGANPSAAFTIAPFLQELSVDLVKDTTPILSFAKYYGGIFVKADSPFKTLKDILEYARKNPGKLTYGHPGVGTRSHLIMEMIAAQEGVKMNFVAFAGDSPEVSAILGGHVLAGGGNAGSIWTSQIQAGELRLIAVEEPMYLYPKVQSLGDLGYNFTMSVMVFAFGPKNLPDAIAKKLDDAFNKASQSQSFKDLTKANMVYTEKNLHREELGKFLQAEKTKTGEFIKKVGLGKK
jgi:tripartite-type tricarboxylate transporter receptor subunit TctC